MDLSAPAGLSEFNSYLSSRSYVAGFTATSADVAFFDALPNNPGAAYPHVARFYRQMSAFTPQEIVNLKNVTPSDPVPSLCSSTTKSTPLPSAIGLPAAVEVDPYSHRSIIKTLLAGDGGARYIGKTVVVGGWVKSGRDQKQMCFLALNDGSTPKNLQVIVEPSLGVDFNKLKSTGSCVLVEGVVKATPGDVKNAQQLVELHATKILHLGESDASKNPIAKTKLSLEFLRTVSHLRPRTNTISAVARIRNALSFATHQFFQSRGFLYVHTPILTASDCEGAGEMFQVSTLLSSCDAHTRLPALGPQEIADATKLAEKLSAELQGLNAKQRKGKEGQKLSADVADAKAVLKDLLFRQSLIGGIPRAEDGTVDYSRDFFSKPSFLTVSGQLEAETFACALSSVYTFGPTFRAEDSHTARHLAEFWMIEPEIAFCDLEGDMQCAEDYVQFCCRYVLETCLEDLEFMTQRIDKDCLERVRKVAHSPFARISYTEAIALLEEHVAAKKVTFENPVAWGIDMASEHERYLCEKVFDAPTTVYNYPKDIKAFYMRLNEDEKTVAAMDVLVPGVGELIGGSQREERLDVLESRIKAMDLDLEPYSWYLDLRRFGTVKHSGFGLGFERLVLFTTGMQNIRDVIPFPRWPGHCDL